MSLFSSLLRWGRNRAYDEGVRHYERGDYERAAPCFERALAEIRDPNHPYRSLASFHACEARANLGRAHFHRGDYAQAEREFQRALAENPRYPDLRYGLARIYQRAGRWDEARFQVEQAVAEQPRFLDAHILRAVCRAQAGDGRGARAALEEALQLGLELPAGLEPGRAESWGTRDWSELLAARPCGGEIAEALERAGERYRAGDLDASVLELERAVKAQPGYPDLR